MKQRAEQNIGTVKRQAEFISYEHENELWSRGILGEDNPDQLRDTVLFLLGINLALRAVDEHYSLRRDSQEKSSQLSFQRNSKGDRCLVYHEDTCTKTNNGGLKHMQKERKIVWIYPNKNDVSHCAVRLVDKYLGLCPSKTKKPNFYLRSLDKYNPGQWYANQVLGQCKIGEVVKNLLKSAKLDGYFTNHSLRRAGMTRLFQAGVDHKLIKEFTGHSSNAVDKYAITSEAQRESLSHIIARKPQENDDCVIESKVKEVVSNDTERSDMEVNIDLNVTSNPMTKCSCNCEGKVLQKEREVERVCDLIRKIITDKDSGKSIINVKIEIKHD